MADVTVQAGAVVEPNSPYGLLVRKWHSEHLIGTKSRQAGCGNVPIQQPDWLFAFEAKHADALFHVRTCVCDLA